MGRRGNKAMWLESQWDRENPFPHFTGVVTERYSLVYIDLYKYHPDLDRELLRLTPVWYRMNRNKLPQKALLKICNKKVWQLQAEYGEGSLWRERDPCHFVDMYKGRDLHEATGLTEGRFTIMYYVELDGIQEGFATKKLRDMIARIREASRKKLRVQIRYWKKTTKKLVTRDCACYSYDKPYLYVTDTRSGNTKIRSYIVDNIRSVRILKKHFKPEYALEL